MNIFLITDLMGTLMEADHMLTHEPPWCKEYPSRLNYVGRKINTFLNGNHNRVAIISNEDHCSKEEIAKVLSDIDSVILSENRARMHYYITHEWNIGLVTDEVFKTENGNDMYYIRTKDKAYESITKQYPHFYYIGMDDMPQESLMAQIIRRGGECSFITKITWKNEKVERMTGDTALAFIDRCCDINKLSKGNILNLEEAYKMLYSNRLDINDLWSLKWQVPFNNYLEKFDFSAEEIDNLYDKNIISIDPSFERAFQKRIVPRIRRK